MTQKYQLLVILSIVSSLFIGCSGSALENDTDTPTPKVLVNAGAAKAVNEQTLVALNAQASGQTEILTYVWRASPALTIIHEDPNVSTASFTAPITTEELSFTFTLTVTDELGNQGSDEVVYRVLPVNIAPLAVIQVEQHQSLNPNQFPAGYKVVLDASQSTDADATDLAKPINEYKWQQIAGEAVLGGISLQGDSLAFVTPVLEQANSVTIEVTVTDEEGAQDTETLTLNIQSAAETLPTVEAGISHEVFSGESINLNGTAKTTVAASEPLDIIWLNDSEKDPQIADLDALQTFAIAPKVTTSENVTFTLRVIDAQGNSVDDSLTVTIKPLPIQPLNDSGVIQQATDSQIFSAYLGDYPGQDGQKGQDIIHANGLSEKAGRGQQGFDFTRLDAIGDEVDSEETTWRCVRDNITGLIWESKTNPSSTDLHNSTHSYTWYQDENNAGFAGDEAGSAASCSLTNCNTSEFIAQVNEQALCNFRDWRLPTHNELLSLVHFGQQNSAMIDTDYFPYTTNILSQAVWYWTQNSSADGISNEQARNAWAIDFTTGNDNFLNKSTAARVRLVRAGR